MPSPIQILAARAAARGSSEGGIQIDPSADPMDLMKEVGGYGLSTFTAAGNFLDLPGSIVRDLVVGKGLESFDQVLTPFSSENRTSGRDVLTKYGITRKNREGGVTDWSNDPTEMVSDIGGFMAEVMLDPFGPIGKLSKADKLIDATGRGVGKLTAGAFKALPGGRAIVGAVGPKVNWLARQSRALFDSSVGGTTNAEAQDIARTFHKRVYTDENELESMITMAHLKADELGFSLDPAIDVSGRNQDAIRRFDEGVTDPTQILDPQAVQIPEELKPMIRAIRAKDDSLRSDFNGLFNGPGDLKDEVDYARRQMHDLLKRDLDENGIKLATKATRQFAQSDATVMSYRDLMFKGMKGGTPNWDPFLRDPEWDDIVQSVRDNPELVKRQDLLQEAYDGVLGPRHLEPFADAVDMDPKELWSELGFDRMKPYATVDEAEAALDGFLTTQTQLAKAGKGKLVTRPNGMRTFDNILTGDSVRVRHTNDSPMLPNNQLPNTLDNVSDADLFAYLRNKAGKDPDALARIAEAEEFGARPVAWDEDGEQQFFLPRMKPRIGQHWEKRLQGLRNRVVKQPLTNKEVTRDMIREKIEQKYSENITKDMPKLDSKGNFIYRVDPQFEQSGLTDSPLRGGAVIKKGRKDSIAFEEEYADAIKLGFIKQDMVDRYDSLADLITNHQRVRHFPLFNKNPLIDTLDGMKSRARMVATGNAVIDWLGRTFVENAGTKIDKFALQKRSRVALYPGEIADGMSVGDFLKANPHFNRESILDFVARDVRGKYGLDHLFTDAPEEPFTYATPKFIESFLATRPEPQVLKELNQMFESFRSLPEVSMLGKIADSALSIQKSGLLSTPSGVFRDGMSALVQSFVMGDIQPWNPKHLGRLKDAVMITRGKLPDDIPMVKEMEDLLRNLQMPDTPNNRAQAFLSLFVGWMHKARTHQLGGDSLSVEASGSAASLLENVPGYKFNGVFRGIMDRFGKQSIWQNINPANARGVMIKEKLDFIARDAKVPGHLARSEEWVPRSTENFIAGVSGDARQFSDNVVRMASLLTHMDKQTSFADAFAKVDLHQVSYDPRNYSRFEKQYMKRLLPFYSFMSRSFKMVATELYTNPGGALGGMIRAQRLAQGGEDSYVPYDLQDQSAIPIKAGQGNLKYITSLGLMHEDSLSYLFPTQGVRGLLQKLGGSSNPLVKMFTEQATNTSMFFDGPMGGRRLDDLDPALGRILQNLGVTTPNESGRPDPFIHPMVEALAANSPAAAAIRIARISTEDPARRSTLEKVMNLATGFRTKVVTPEQIGRELRDRLNAEEIALGARPMTIVTGVSKLTERLRSEGRVQEADKLEAIQQVLQVLKKRRDEELKKEQKKAGVTTR